MDTLLVLPIQQRVVDTNTLLRAMESTLIILKTLDISTNSQIQQKNQAVNCLDKESTHLNLKKVATKQTQHLLELKLETRDQGAKILHTNIPLIRVMVSTVMMLRLPQVVVMTMTLLFNLRESTLMVVILGILGKIAKILQQSLLYPNTST